MRGGSSGLLAISFCLSACASPEPARLLVQPPSPAQRLLREPVENKTASPFEPESVHQIPISALPEPMGGGIKGSPGVVPAKMEPAPREPGFEELLKLQKDIAARRPES